MTHETGRIGGRLNDGITRRALMRNGASVAMLAAALTLAACGGFRDSRLNPRNWFKRSAPETVTAEVPPGDPRPLVDQVTELTITPMPGGAIVTATGLPPTQGWWEAELVREDAEPKVDENGTVTLPDESVVTYRFLVQAPPGPRRTSTPQSRQVTAGAFLSDIKLSGVRKIVVLGAQSSRSISR